MTRIQKAVALLLAFVLTVGAFPLSAFATEPEPTEATAPLETQPLPSESPPEETAPEPTPTAPPPINPDVTEPSIPESTAPAEPEVTAPSVPETTASTEPVPETTVPETTVPETVPETTAPVETAPPEDDFCIKVGDSVFIVGGQDEIDRYAARKTIKVVDMQFISIGQTNYSYFVNLGGKNVQWSWDGYINEMGYAKLADGTIAYCMQPHYAMPDGEVYDIPFDSWHEVKQLGMARALAYGSPNNGDTSKEGLIATQAVIWDIACGYRYYDGSFNYSDRYGQLTSSPFRGAISNNATIRDKYDLIVYRMGRHGMIPSFTSKTEGGIGTAQTITLKQAANGNYTASVRDTNQILSAFRFPSPVSGMTFSYSGSTLNITATPAAAAQLMNGVVVRSRRSAGEISIKDPIAWTKDGYSSTSGRKYQEIVSLPYGIDPVPCFFKVRVEASPGSATIKKTSDRSVNGYCFKMYKWEGSISYYGKTDANGNMYQTDASFNKTGGYEWTGLTDGTYTFKEVLSAHGAGQVFPTSWRITVTDKSGKTTYNRTFSGSEIQKESSGDAKLSESKIYLTGLTGGGKLTMTIHNASYDAPFTLKKSMKGDPDVIAQFQNNACYSLSGAEYGVYKGGTWQETIKTNANGDAASAKRYPNGTVLTLKELKAPPGFRMDDTVHTITIRSGQANVVYVSDEPTFDPYPLEFEKKDPATGLTVPQGNASFAGAVFKWDYYDNQNWSGSPKRTWYFKAKGFEGTSKGYHAYRPEYLANEYQNDDLYFTRNQGKVGYNIPVGSIRVTEVKAPAGYGKLPELKANITQPTNGGAARFVWTPESAAIVQSKDGKYLFPEPEDRSTYASISIQKQDADTGGAAPSWANFAGCEFTVYNRSANPVKIGSFPTAAPGEACYVLTLDAAGRAATGAEFPLGKYEIRETKGNAYYQCNTGWSQTFEVTMGGNTAFNFSVANTPVKGHIQLTKIDSTDGKPLTGAVFTVTHPDGHTENMVEEANGIHALRNLRYGKYTVQETKAPEGFRLDPTVYTVEITENGKVYEVKTPGYEGVANAPVPGSISIQKVDTHGNPMPGVSFKLEYSLDDGATWLPVTSRAPDAPLTPGTSSTPGIVDGVLTTQENGALLFEGLRINSQTGNIRYRLTEVATTNGNTLMAGIAFDGYLDAECPTKLIFATNGAAFELPTSGSTELAVVQLVGAAIIMLALIGFSATSFSSKLDQAEEKKKHRR